MTIHFIIPAIVGCAIIGATLLFIAMLNRKQFDYQRTLLRRLSTINNQFKAIALLDVLSHVNADGMYDEKQRKHKETQYLLLWDNVMDVLKNDPRPIDISHARKAKKC